MSDMSDILVFNRDHVRRNRNRARSTFEAHDFLFDWATHHLCDRLFDIKRTFTTACHIGSRAHIPAHEKIGTLRYMDITTRPVLSACTPYFCANEEFLPLKPQSQDLILSTLNLHSVNDLPGTLVQIRRSLKPDGLFLAAMLGGETLYELREVMTEIELEMMGGISPRIAPFADKPQMGDLLQRAGFNLPVVDSDIITVTYESAFKLFQDLKGMGENNAIQARTPRPPGKEFFFRTAQRYHDKFAQADGRIVASFEVIFLLGWAPHESQQKPLRPGSAKHSLAEALNTEEIKTGEETKP